MFKAGMFVKIMTTDEALTIEGARLDSEGDVELEIEDEIVYHIVKEINEVNFKAIWELEKRYSDDSPYWILKNAPLDEDMEPISIAESFMIPLVKTFERRRN